MKKVIQKIAAALVVVSVIVSCGSPEPKTISIDTNSEEKAENSKELLAENKAEVEMNVDGMTCAMGCAKYIEDKVADLDGIHMSTVNFDSGTAYFEYDKTELSSEEIEEYINSIHEGQYKATIAIAESEEESTEEAEESLSSVSERINIHFPDIFTYFLKRIR